MAKSTAKDARVPAKSLRIAGFSGLKQSGGIIDEEFLARLKGDFANKTYREMSDNSSTIGAIFYVIKSLIRQVEWRVEPAGKEQAALDWAQFLEECMTDMSITWEDTISEVTSFLNYGWSLFELIYKVRKGLETKDPTRRSQYNDGKIGWRKIALRAQDTLDRWEFDPNDGGLLGMHQVSETDGKTAFIPIEKSILFRTEVTKDNPEGRSILRNAVVDYFYLKRIQGIEAVGIERDMTGLLTMEVPESLLSTDAPSEVQSLRTQLEKMLSELKRDEREFALIPSEQDREGKPTGYKLKLLSTGGSRQIDTNNVKQWYKTNILQSVLAQFLQLGMTNVGSFALASSQTDMFATALGATLQIITSTFNRFGVGPLMEINNVPRELWPELVHGDIETPALNEVAAYITALAGAGQLPEDEIIQRRLLEIGGLPIPEEGGHDEGSAHLEPTEKSGVRKAFKRGRTHSRRGPTVRHRIDTTKMR